MSCIYTSFELFFICVLHEFYLIPESKVNKELITRNEKLNVLLNINKFSRLKYTKEEVFFIQFCMHKKDISLFQIDGVFKYLHILFKENYIESILCIKRFLHLHIITNINLNSLLYNTNIPLYVDVYSISLNILPQLINNLKNPKYLINVKFNKGLLYFFLDNYIYFNKKERYEIIKLVFNQFNLNDRIINIDDMIYIINLILDEIVLIHMNYFNGINYLIDFVHNY
jgi:hypothetical protein